MRRSKGRIKGTGIVGIVRALRTFREQAKSLLPPQLLHYLEDRIVLTSWYAEDDYLALMEAFMRIQHKASWEQVGAVAAREALSSVYRNVIIKGDVPETAQRMRINWRNYHDTGELSVENEPQLVRVTVRDYCMISTPLCRLNQGYFAALLEMAHSVITDQRKVRCTARGDTACVWEFGWRATA